MQVGLYGEVKVIVKRADDTVRLDTGFFPNVITNLGLDAIGNDNDLFNFCAVGGGNSKPLNTNTKLDNPLQVVSPISSESKYDYDPVRDTEFYKCSGTVGYRFEGLDNKNISEVGLVGDYRSELHSAFTRTLIKNSAGEPTVITVLSGEILELQYRLWQVFDVKDKDQVVTAMIDGVEVPFNVKIRLAGVGGNLGGSWSYAAVVGAHLTFQGNNYHQFGTGELGEITGQNSGLTNVYGLSWEAYQPSTYKRKFYANTSITEAVHPIRSFLFFTGLGAYQVRFGTVDGDLPIDKTNQDILQLGFEMSWGRYEGVI